MALGDSLRLEWAPTEDATADIDPASTSWEDISDVLVSGRTQSGWANVFDLFAASTATFVIRNGSMAGQTPLFEHDEWYRGKQMRLVAPHASGVAPEWGVYHGHITSVKHDQSDAPVQGNVTVGCSDRLGLIADVEIPGIDDDSNPRSVKYWLNYGYASSRRVDKNDRVGYIVPGPAAAAGGAMAFAEYVASLAGVSFDYTGFENAAQVQVFIPAELTGNALQALQDYLEAERARILTDPLSGKLIYRGRWSQIAAAAAGPQWTLSATTDPPIHRQEFELAEPGTDHYTQAVFGDVFGPTSLADNTPTGEPPAVLSRPNLPFADHNWSQATADMIVAVYSGIDTFPQKAKILTWAATRTVDASSPALAQIGTDAFSVTFTPVGGVETTWLLLAEGIDHTFDQSAWFTTFRFSNLQRWVDAYGDDGLFVLGTSALGGPEILGP